MATPLYSSKLSETKFKNYIKAGLGVLYTKEGIEPFVYDEIEQFQQKCLSDICNNNGLVAGTTCSSCCTQNVIVCPTNRICNVGRGKCKFHRNSATQYLQSGCPNKICHNFKNEIQYAHRFCSPSYKNTDASQWCSSAWEVAKCFMPPDGYNDVTSAAETDFNGIVSVIINYKAFQSKVQDDLSKKSNIFEQGREVSRAVRHSPQLEIEDTDLQQYFTDLQNLLSDPAYLSANKDAQNAKTKLLQLQNDTLVIGKNDIQNVLDNVAKAVQYEIRTEIDDQKKEAEKKKLELINITNESVKVIANQATLSIAHLDKALHSAIDELEKQTKESLKKVQSETDVAKKQINDCADKGVNKLEDKAEAELKKLCAKADEKLKQIEKSTTGNKEEASKKYEMPKIDRPHDGRLITLSRDELKGLLDNCDSDAARKGGFGNVHFTKKKVRGLDIRVAIKMIDCREKNEDHTAKIRSASNEMIASRVMHFAIVPLIAYMDEELEDNKRAFYFISPYFENGSLLEVIEKDKQCSDTKYIHLSSFRRKRILFQIASALDFLHTEVPGSRGKVLHMDLSSKNIVLDENWNARLIDFGLGREMNEGQSEGRLTESKRIGTKGYWTAQDYSTFRVCDDNYNFGVVTRELITGKAPFNTKDRIELRKLEEKTIENHRQKNIWTKKEEASPLIKLSTKCLKSRDDKNFSSAHIVNELKTMFQNPSSTRNTSTCDLCIVNPAVEAKRAPPHLCTESVNVCTSCMRNSHVNPIRCPTCNDTAIPKIGHTYAAVLIAGNDLENEGLANSFRSDVLALKDVLSSKCPCVIGMRDENIKVIAPSSPGKADKLSLQVHEAFRSLESEQNLGTLFVYFTGHYIPDKGFILSGPDDVLTLQKIQEEISNIYTQWGETARIFMFLDCCKAPGVLDILKLHGKMIQLNACRPDESCSQSVSGSKFLKFFYQALTRRAYNKNCYNSNSSSSETECEDCVMSGDIITVQQLLTYISKHMDKCYNGKDPILYVHGITADDSCIGYNVDFVVDLKFIFKEESGLTTDVVIKHEMFSDIKSLKERILDTVLCEAGSDGTLKLTPKDFSDAVALHIHDGSEHGLELHSMQRVSWALDGKREIVACYRTLSNILKGLVAVFIDTTYITKYLRTKGFLIEQEDGMKARFSHEEFQSGYSAIDNEVDSSSGEMSQNVKDALRRFLDELLIVDVMWDQADYKDSRELKIFFPRLIDHKWHDFMLMDLSV